MKTAYQPKTGAACSCKRGQQRDNCPQCEGTGQVIDFAKIRAGTGSEPPARPIAGIYRTADGKAQIEWSVEDKENGPEFSASAEYKNGGGQIIGEIAKDYPADLMVQRIFKVWKKYHLNGMKAGLAMQEDFLRANKGQRVPGDYYSWACQALKDAGLYEVFPDGEKATGGFPDEVISLGELATLREKIKTGSLFPRYGSKDAELSNVELAAKVEGRRGYHYGERWVYSPIPPEVLAEIKSWSDSPQPKESLHDAKAAGFLAKNKIKFRATLSDSKTPPWQDESKESGHHYRITLSRTGKRIVFDFWASVNDRNEGIKTVSAYSALSCISSDIHCPATFQDFCSEFGYEQDSIKAMQMFRRLSAFASRLRAFFTAAEIEDLNEIQ